jgi:hypothetical protein
LVPGSRFVGCDTRESGNGSSFGLAIIFPFPPSTTWVTIHNCGKVDTFLMKSTRVLETQRAAPSRRNGREPLDLSPATAEDSRLVNHSLRRGRPAILEAPPAMVLGTCHWPVFDWVTCPWIDATLKLLSPALSRSLPIPRRESPDW